MNKVKLLSWLFALMVILNLGLTGFILFRKPPHPNPDRPRNIIIEKLKFDDNQIAKYDELIKEHRNEIGKREDQIMELKNELYSQLNTTESSAANSAIIEQLVDVQREIETIHFNHFLDIKNLCTNDQLPLFKTLTGELASLFNMHPPKPPKN